MSPSSGKATTESGGERKVGRGKESGTGPFAGTQAGGQNDGVSSAKPQAVTGKEDATFKTGTEKLPD